MGTRRFGLRRTARILLLTVAAGVVLGGCQARRSAPSPELTTGSVPRQNAEAWGRRFESNPSDREAAIGYAQALRANGQTAQAVAVLQRAVLQNPRDGMVASAYGKALAANGDFQEALKVIRRSTDPTAPDWRLLSAEAAIQDQLGNPTEARRIYFEALKIAPNEPTILNNLGLSYVLTNELPAAEKVLRQAVASPQADARVRQNLALALGLQGKFAEAEKVATAALPPAEAAENMAYLKTMMSQQNTWKQIKAADRPKS